jgi:hypothetical protein
LKGKNRISRRRWLIVFRIELSVRITEAFLERKNELESLETVRVVNQWFRWQTDDISFLFGYLRYWSVMKGKCRTSAYYQVGITMKFRGKSGLRRLDFGYYTVIQVDRRPDAQLWHSLWVQGVFPPPLV